MTGAKLTPAEIARQARDTSHLEPDPVLCLADGYRCTACGDAERVDADWGLPWDWMGKHRGGACQRQARGGDTARSGTGTTSDASGGPRRVLGGKDSKDGGAA